MPDGTKPLCDPVFIQINNAVWHHFEWVYHCLRLWGKLNVSFYWSFNSFDSGDRIFRLCGINTMPTHALAGSLSRRRISRHGIDSRRHVGLLHCEFGLLLLTKIQDTIRNVNTSFSNLWRNSSHEKYRTKWCTKIHFCFISFGLPIVIFISVFMKKLIAFGKIYIDVFVHFYRNKWKSKKSISSHFKYLVRWGL